MKTTKLRFKYSNRPGKFCDMQWYQRLNYKCLLHGFSKQDLIQKRDELTRDIVEVFAKHGISLEHFRKDNEYGI